MLRGIAMVISYLFHPVFIPVIMTALLTQLLPASFSGLRPQQTGFLLIQVAYITAFFPLLVVLLLKGLGFVDSVYLKDSKERIIPLMATMIFYFWAYWVFRNDRAMSAPLIVKSVFLANFWSLIALFMINIFFKISMHATAMGGLLGMMIVILAISPVNMALPLFAAIFAAGLVGTARMILKAHHLNELWTGYGLGILSQVAAYWYLS